VRSSLTLRLGRAQRAGSGIGRLPPRLRRLRFRQLEVSYRIAELRGDVTIDAAGVPEEAECGPLDSCGLGGTIRVAPALGRGTFGMFATARAPTRRRVLREALGLEPSSGRPVTVNRYGAGEWEGAGRTEVSLGRPDGGTPCTDVAEQGLGHLNVEFDGQTVRAGLYPHVPRGRCPGPVLGFEQSVASAEVPLSAFRSPRVEIPLTRPESLLDQGWTATTRPALTVVLERTRIRETVRRFPF
nr:hypothetical protein [Actinomycetota bacterium]